MTRHPARLLGCLALLATAGCLDAPETGIVRPASLCAGDPGYQSAVPGPWSLAAYPGWIQAEAPADEVAATIEGYGVFTHIQHAGIVADPGGLLTFQSSSLWSEQQACSAVAGVHRTGRPILVVLGGGDAGYALSEAARPENRPVLIASIVDFIDTYGYDGVTIAWYESIDFDNLIALVDELADAFAARTPRPLLVVEADSGLIDPQVTAQLSSRVDAVSLMSWWDGWDGELVRHTDAGVPPGRINLGIGLASDLEDLTPEAVRAKIDYARDNGLRGVYSWQIGDLAGTDDARVAEYARLFDAQ